MIDMHVGDHQGQHVLHGEAHLELLEGVDAVGVLALEEPAVDEQRAVLGDLQPMAAAGHAAGAAVVKKQWIGGHGARPPCRGWSFHYSRCGVRQPRWAASPPFARRSRSPTSGPKLQESTRCHRGCCHGWLCHCHRACCNCSRLLLLVGATLRGAKGRRPQQPRATPPDGFAAIRPAEPISHQWPQASGVIPLPQRLLRLVGATLCGAIRKKVIYRNISHKHLSTILVAVIVCETAYGNTFHKSNPGGSP